MNENLRYDWREVVELKPEGEMELRGHRLLRGAVKDIMVIDQYDNVIIIFDWLAYVDTADDKLGKLKREDKDRICFPNRLVHFIIEDAGADAGRIRFGESSFIYLRRIEGFNTLDTSEIEGF